MGSLSFAFRILASIREALAVLPPHARAAFVREVRALIAPYTPSRPKPL